MNLNMASYKTCGLHVATDLSDNEKLIESSEKSINRIADFVQQWIHLDGVEQTVASELDSLLQDGETHTVYYHRKCYMCFTDKVRVQKAKQRIDRAKPESENNCTQKRLTFYLPLKCFAFPKYLHNLRKRSLCVPV